ncbi:DUF881 domain-containing protein [Naumannella sp. ID2617S]|uniref:DUF881 domain-containing protein n=2 Tax=Enemella dayhoffiae TaxID=2016507 RepID=A0A255HCR3_9ACTN|nr:DUF881 domain-containing protein [Naumannella sp. ID2617S]OYO25362.1 hypothetical protein CGZ93_01100 [Enemella dayhoffiae]
MIAVSSLNARGTDLRPARNTDLVDLVRTESRRNTELARQVSQLRAEVDQLSTSAADSPGSSEALARATEIAALTPVKGPGMTVALSDAPSSVQAPGVDQDLLVVHQQDIQAVVNVLWSAGAEAMTIQGQRVVSTTGIKCVGNTVVLHGIPYAPPYTIRAIGDPKRLEDGLANSEFVRIYQQYVQVYHLGYTQRTETELVLPGHQGSVDLAYARPLR